MLVGSMFGYLRADLNGDCRVDFEDLAILMQEWMMEDEDCLMNLGNELVTNGAFDDETGWTTQGIGFGWYIFSGNLRWVGFVGAETASQSIAIQAGKTYRVVYILTAPCGLESFAVKLGGTVVSELKEAVTYTYDVVAGSSDTNISFVGTASLGSQEVRIDNVSVKEILGGAALSSDMLGVFLEEK